MGRGLESPKKETPSHSWLHTATPPGTQGQRSLHLIRSHSQEEGEKVAKNKVVSDASVLQPSLGHFKEQDPVFL